MIDLPSFLRERRTLITQPFHCLGFLPKLFNRFQDSFLGYNFLLFLYLLLFVLIGLHFLGNRKLLV